MELREYVTILRRWVWLIALGTLLAGGTAFIVSRNIEPVYRSSTMLFLNPAASSPLLPFSLSLSAEDLARTYSESMRTWSFAELVAQEMGGGVTPDEVLSAISTRHIPRTQFFEVSAINTDPGEAQKLANTSARVLVTKNIAHQRERQEQQQQIKGPLGGEETPVDTAVVWDRARLPTEPLERKMLQNTLLAAIVGCMLAVGVAFLIEYLDDTIKTSEDVSQALGLPTLGAIPYFNPNEGGKLVTVAHPRSPISEACRTLCANIQFLAVGKRRPIVTLLFASAVPGEGKTTLAAIMAQVMAQTGKRVIIVDSDLCHPTLHQYFEVSKDLGLTNVLLDEKSNLDGYLQ